MVTITGNSNTQVTQTSASTLNPLLSIGQKIEFTLSGNSSSYYLSSAINNAYKVTVQGALLIITGTALGSGRVSICSSTGSCATFAVTVVGANGTAAQATTTTIGSNYHFTNPLRFGSKGQEVIELQKRLHEEGFFNGNYVANFGIATVNAVKKFQTAHSLKVLGNLGPVTRSLFNK